MFSLSLLVDCLRTTAPIQFADLSNHCHFLQKVDWVPIQLPIFNAAAWKVSWSLSGNVLAVSTADNKVTLWKETVAGAWNCVKTIDDESS